MSEEFTFFFSEKQNLINDKVLPLSSKLLNLTPFIQEDWTAVQFTLQPETFSQETSHRRKPLSSQHSSR